ncbi:hypothetical protein K488DRAFT_41705 [Vararia minispora EC-137]|uniref:Uncharacterized protein n=1 Tax=Vararia minispora EC-137 TaxID=1314806 RepID=A0ACB8QX44_9AGAM|nr:hypothetical protein K488DRAFT_41705 [Vararia minispora EC-137]
MKLNNPLPQSLPKECDKASKIFKSFVDGGNNGLDGVIPRSVLENAKGFAIFTIFKAGFVFSARAGSGIVIARLQDGSWSAPSAIGLAGLGFGGQAGAEVTDFLIVLNSHSRQFMAAGSLTLGGNMSLAIGPLGRNGEATGAVNSSGKLAAMYSYSKTKGLFGGVSIEGSVIVERQDANAIAYRSDVAVKQLLSGSVDVPSWAVNLVNTLNACTGMPGGRQWVDERSFNGSPSPLDGGYAFNGISSSGAETPNSRKGRKSPFPPLTWGQRKDEGSYFGPEDRLTSDLSGRAYDPPRQALPATRRDIASATAGFGTHFESDFRAPSGSIDLGRSPALAPTHTRSYSETPRSSTGTHSYENPFAPTIEDDDPFGLGLGSSSSKTGTSSGTPRPYIAAKKELAVPMPIGGIARAIALFDFAAVQGGDLSFKKGQVITVTEKTDDTNTWWKGKLEGREGVFPANFVEIV